MTPKQFDQFRKAAAGQSSETVVALIVDSPWLPGFAGMDTISYFTQPDRWLNANLALYERFPDVIFLPGFWVEYGMAIEPSAFGCKLSWWETSPPSLSHVINDAAEVRSLRQPDPKTHGLMPLALNLQKLAAQRIRPLGFDIKMVAARGPLALAGHLRGIMDLMIDIKTDPDNAHRLLSLCTDTVIGWLRAQADNVGSAESVLVLDDVAGMLGRQDYEEFAHPYLSRVFGEFKGMLRVYHNDANVEPFIDLLPDAGVDVLNFSHELPISKAISASAGRMALLGNVPPLQVMAQGAPEDVRSSALGCLEQGSSKLILSTGGGLSPGTPAENIDELVACGKEALRKAARV